MFVEEAVYFVANGRVVKPFANEVSMVKLTL